MSLADDINRLVRVKKIKKDLDILPTPAEVVSSRGGGVIDSTEKSTVFTPPLEITILTYDDTKDVEIEDTSAATWTLKTAATALITDSEGREFEIDTITFTTPP